MTEEKFRVCVTCIIYNGDDEVLLTRRSADKKRWPGKWTVPGGHVSTEDFIGQPTQINNQWYSVLENAVRREVKEEVGLNIGCLEFVSSIATPDCIIISFKAASHGPKVKINEEECDAYEWVYVGGGGDDPAETLKKYDLIEGIDQEILEVARYL